MSPHSPRQQLRLRALELAIEAGGSLGSVERAEAYLAFLDEQPKADSQPVAITINGTVDYKAVAEQIENALVDLQRRKGRPLRFT